MRFQLRSTDKVLVLVSLVVLTGFIALTFAATGRVMLLIVGPLSVIGVRMTYRHRDKFCADSLGVF